MKNATKFGVIGVGGRGDICRFAHRPDEGFEIAAGADVDPDALVVFRERYGRDVYCTDDYRKLLARPEIAAVFVTSPDFLHEEHAVAALEAGKDVFLEKPMAITLAGCDRILETARREGRKLYVGHNMRHMPVIEQMKTLVDSGRIGEVKAVWCRHFIAYGAEAYFKRWHAEKAKSTGLLLHKGSHDLDIIHWLAGGHATRVHAMGNLGVFANPAMRREPGEKAFIRDIPDAWPPGSIDGLNPVIEVEDLSMMQMELNNGILASYQQCHYTPDSWRNYTVIGTEGRLENFGDYGSETGVVVRLWNQPPDYNPEGDEQYPITNGSLREHGGADRKLVQEFLDFVSNDQPIRVSAVAARESVAAGYLATLSLRDGGTVREVPEVSSEIRDYFDSFCQQ